LFYQVPDPVALFPLNSTFGTKEINNRVAEWNASGVTFAPGPDGVAGGSYEFSGSLKSFIEFPNSAGEPLDVRYSITMLCWVYYNGQDGPLFDYSTSSVAGGVQLRVFHGELYVGFTSRDYSSFTHYRLHTALADGWKFVGATYDNSTGKAKLWVNGAVAQTHYFGAGLELATQGSIRMGANDWGYSVHAQYFKGRITQMQVYNEALTQEQIQAIQQQTEAVGEYVTKQNVQWKHARFGYQIGSFVMFSFYNKISHPLPYNCQVLILRATFFKELWYAGIIHSGILRR